MSHPRVAPIYCCWTRDDPSFEGKAANLLYFVVKNHSFHDGDKRIAAMLFLHYLNMNNALLQNGGKRISDSALVCAIILLRKLPCLLLREQRGMIAAGGWACRATCAAA
ncbi:Fic family protein [Senegalimassilia anaerobia]|uniref:Fic family protein n=1 Tax=Senegalimassilia anaerobia TaxID=1473216 RepID=UPI0039B4AE15